MDLICSKCGEPWEVAHVLHEEPEKFERKGGLITGCPCCDENLKYQNEELSDDEKENHRERLESIKEVCLMLGDDIDGTAAMLEDLGFA